MAPGLHSRFNAAEEAVQARSSVEVIGRAGKSGTEDAVTAALPGGFVRPGVRALWKRPM
jgi:hypothetical protein